MDSIWQNVEMPNFPALSEDRSTDVLIIGGGIAGILTAFFLEREGVDYILLEKDKICNGVTARTTAKITAGHSFCYQKILSSQGKSIAQGYYLANMQALKEYFSLAQNIDCDFNVRDNYVYSFDVKKIEKELDALQKIAAQSEFSNELELPFNTAGAVKLKNQASFHPLKFLSQISKNLNIFEHTKVREMIGNTAVTEKGKIKAKQVVVATHFPFINKHGKYFLKLYQHRSYVLALKGAESFKGMYVDEDDKGLSFREYGDLLLFGGGGHRTGKQYGGYSELRKMARLYYPNAREVTAWATQDCISLDKMCYIGNYGKGANRIFVASGFNKWGMTGAMVSARILTDMLLGRVSEFEDVFTPQRSIVSPQLFINGFESVSNLLRPTAPRCPHLGCALKWNKQEHSWDCSCHGSRFDNNGELLNGPATDGL